MLNMINKLIIIIRAKFRDKDKMMINEWYVDRISKCGICPYNSKNVKNRKSIWYKMWNILNFKKPFCTICGCEIKAKASEELENCSLYELNKEPKWKSLI